MSIQLTNTSNSFTTSPFITPGETIIFTLTTTMIADNYTSFEVLFACDSPVDFTNYTLLSGPVAVVGANVINGKASFAFGDVSLNQSSKLKNQTATKLVTYNSTKIYFKFPKVSMALVP